jgi:hypothetical protein
MIEIIHKNTELAGAFITGFLFSLIIILFREISHSLPLILTAIILISGAIFLAKKTARHFHGEHTHAGDSTIDIVALLILLLVNIFHPAVDGFSFYELLIRQGFLAGAIFASGVIVHEIVRQSVLVTVFKNMGVKWWWVVLTAVFGIGLGICAGFFSSNFLRAYEWVIDLSTIFAYSFIVAEFYYSGHFVNKNSQIGAFFVGIIVGILASILS